jgi:hypothetical protein
MQHPDEMNFDDLPAADRELESALGGMAPAAPRRPRDEWLFKAGAESARAVFRRRLRTWQSLAAVLALSTTASILIRPSDRAQPRDVGARHELAARTRPSDSSPLTPQAPWAPRPVDPDSALALRDAVLARGIDALPNASTDRQAPQPIQSLRGLVWQ